MEHANNGVEAAVPRTDEKVLTVEASDRIPMGGERL